jgi:Zn-dependent protease with chaperone function
MMMKLKQLAVCLTLFAATVLATAQDAGVVVQDGIEVKPLSRMRVLAPEEQVNEAARLQYTEMMSQAKEKGLLAPASDPQLKRLRTIAQRIIPFTPRWNPVASKWEWQVNLIQADEVNAFCMPMKPQPSWATRSRTHCVNTGASAWPSPTSPRWARVSVARCCPASSASIPT